MTEEQWLACADPTAVLCFLRGRASDRKLRLFAVACCRLNRHMLMTDTLAALEVAEDFADGRITREERRVARARAFASSWHPDLEYRHRRGPAKACVTAALARRAFEAASKASWFAEHTGLWPQEMEERKQVQAELLRDIFGNPFRPPVPDRRWITSSVAAAAQSIYGSRRFDRVPELVEDLEQAACKDADLLAHCRREGPHVRGCWVLDLVLGKQ